MRRGIVPFVLALVVAIAMLSPAPVHAAQTPTGIATDLILQPPPYNGQPLEVTIGLHIVNIAAIDEVNEQFQMDAYLFARWTDPRLAFTPSGPNDHERDYALGQIWIPQLEIINAATPRERYDTSIRVAPDGTVKLRGAMQGRGIVQVRTPALPVRSTVAADHHSSLPRRRTSYQVQVERLLDLDGERVRELLVAGAVEVDRGRAANRNGADLRRPDVPRGQVRDLRAAPLELLFVEGVPAVAADGVPVVGGFLDRGERSLEPGPGRGHDDSHRNRVRVRDFRDDAAPALPDVHRCVLSRVLHLRFPRGSRADDGPRNPSLRAP